MPAFLGKTKKSDTLVTHIPKVIRRMQAPSEPQVNKENPKKWFIYWNHDVPVLLWDKYAPRRRIRIVVKDNINRVPLDRRAEHAEERRLVWKYKLEKLNYNPFQEELAELQEIGERKEVVEKVKVLKEKKEKLTVGQLRKLTPVGQACDLWVESRKGRTKNINSVSTYRVTATWFKAHFEQLGTISMPVSKLTRIDVSEALEARKKAKKWQPTTYNNEMDTLVNMFNWLELEEYVPANPIRGKLLKVKTQKHKHKWFDKDIKKKVKDQLLADGELLVYRVMQFTYEILIRSKTELMKLKAGDIDRTLKRVRFSADLSKNEKEAFRDYPPAFDALLDEMNFDAIPKNFYVFGRAGEPSEFKCHKDLFAERWRPVREKLGLSADYTIYGMKHTRIVHELFKGTEGYDISHMARHDDPKSTKEYMRDYDITLKNIYGPEDLCF